jgi:molecular chaperone GrpE
MSDTDTVDPTPEEAKAEEPQQAAPPQADVNPLEAEIAALKDQLLRALAETENVRRRMEREREDTAKFAISKFAQNLLPVADNLRRAIEAVPVDQHDNELVKKVIEGIEATERTLLQAFEKSDIKQIDAMGKVFDANFHEVMVELEYPDQKPGTVMQLFETGYMISDRLLRPARVAIAKGGSRERLDTNA